MKGTPADAGLLALCRYLAVLDDDKGRLKEIKEAVWVRLAHAPGYPVHVECERIYAYVCGITDLACQIYFNDWNHTKNHL